MNRSWDSLNGGDSPADGFDGMTLRDYFAAKAMRGYMACYTANESCDEVEVDGPEIADMAYKIADAMLNQRTR